MIILDTTSTILRLVTSSAADLEVNADLVDHTESTELFRSKVQKTKIAAAATTTVVAAPASGDIKRNVKHLSVRNKHASTANTVTVEKYDGTNPYEYDKITLQAGEKFMYNDAGVLFVYDANGGVKVGASAASDTLAGLIRIATQAEMEAPSSNLLAVSPGRAHFHPGVAKFVCMTTGTATPVMQTPPSYNVTSITDSGVGRLTITIATDFSSANWCCQSQCEIISTTLTAAANVMQSYIRFGGQAAGTMEINVCDRTATTNVIRDPITHHVVGYGDQA